MDIATMVAESRGCAQKRLAEQAQRNPEQAEELFRRWEIYRRRAESAATRRSR